MVSATEVKNAVEEVLSTSDMAELSRKKVRLACQEKLGEDLTSFKSQIKEWVRNFETENLQFSQNETFCEINDYVSKQEAADSEDEIGNFPLFEVDSKMCLWVGLFYQTHFFPEQILREIQTKSHRENRHSNFNSEEEKNSRD